MNKFWRLAGTAFIAVLGVVSGANLDAQAMPGAPVVDAISVAIVADGTRGSRLSGAGVQFGPVAHFDPRSTRERNGRGIQSFTVGQQVGIRTARRSGLPGRVMLSAYLSRDCFPIILSIDGIPLTSAPKLIAADVQLNSITHHRVELEIPDSAPAGPIDAEIVWQAEER